MECANQMGATNFCVQMFGCKTAMGCQNATAPGGQPACECPIVCAPGAYSTTCWQEGTASFCDCRKDQVSLGICEGGAGPFCSVFLDQSCCKELFNLPL
jgi:hypothetical protein